MVKNSNYIIWLDLNNERPFEKYIRNEHLNIEWAYLIHGFMIDEELLGLFIFQFNKNDYIFEQNIHELFKVADNTLKKSIIYLSQRRSKKLFVEPIFSNRDSIIKDDSIFVIMPFCEEWSSRIWLKILKPHIESLGYHPKRADDLYGRDIMEDIWTSILQSKYIIADITSRNANVFYELGIAHTLGKEVILLSQNIDDIPFDLNRYRHIIYKDNYDGYEILKNNITNSLADDNKPNK